MIIAKAPLRISFLGGGSDLPSHYLEHGGACISMAIDKYIYIAVNKRFNSEVRLSYSRTEIVQSSQLLEHDLAREALLHFNILYGTEVVSIADIPGSGSGLGSSSTFTVALLIALKQYLSYYTETESRIPWSPKDIAETACEIEINKLVKPIGKQDQYAAAHGGINQFVFGIEGDVWVESIPVTSKLRTALSDNLMLLYTGRNRKSSSILAEQDENNKSGRNAENLKRMAVLSNLLCKDFRNGDASNLGEYLHENWMLKKELASNISNPDIDDMYDIAMKAGATGGKIAGAGGGGFFLVCAPPDKHMDIRHALSLKEIKIMPDPRGARIAFMEGLHD